MTARDQLLAALQRANYSRQGAADLLASYETQVLGEAAHRRPFEDHAAEALRVAALDGTS